MQARAAFWKFWFEQTQGRSALKKANSSSVPPATPSETVNHVLRRAASSRGSGGRAVDDAGVDADLSVGRESRGGEDEGGLPDGEVCGDDVYQRGDGHGGGEK